MSWVEKGLVDNVDHDSSLVSHALSHTYALDVGAVYMVKDFM